MEVVAAFREKDIRVEYLQSSKSDLQGMITQCADQHIKWLLVLDSKHKWSHRKVTLRDNEKRKESSLLLEEAIREVTQKRADEQGPADPVVHPVEVCLCDPKGNSAMKGAGKRKIEEIIRLGQPLAQSLRHPLHVIAVNLPLDLIQSLHSTLSTGNLRKYKTDLDSIGNFVKGLDPSIPLVFLFKEGSFFPFQRCELALL